MITTRGSVARGIIRIKRVRGDDIVEALQESGAVIAGAINDEPSGEKKQEAPELVAEIVDRAGSENPPKGVLRCLAMGSEMWSKP